MTGRPSAHPEATAAIDDFLGGQPLLRTRTQALLDSLWDPDRLDPVLTELCRLRIAQILGCDAELARRATHDGVPVIEDEAVTRLSRWPTDQFFDARQRVVLGWCEQYVIDPSGITDADAERLHQHLSEAEMTALTMAVAVFDALIRARVALEEARP